MKRFLILTLAFVLTFSVAGCGNAAQESQVQENTEKSADATPSNQSDAVNPATTMLSFDTNGDGMLQSNEFPVPTGKTFGIESQYSELYTLAAAASSERIVGNLGKDSTDLVIPTLCVYGEYDAEAGGKNYICGYGEQFYYDVGKNVAVENAPVYSSNGGGGTIARLTVKNGELVDIQET